MIFLSKMRLNNLYSRLFISLLKPSLLLTLKVIFTTIVLTFLKSAWALDVPPQPIAPYGLFSTFSAETLKKDNSAYSLSLERSVEPDYYITRLSLAYGITEKIEFGLSVPYVTGEETDGLGDASFGFKYRLVDEGKYGPSLTTIFYVSPPTGDELITSEGRFSAGGFLTKRVGPITAHLNLLYSKPASSSLKDEIVISGGFDFSASHSFDIIGEIYAMKPHTGDSFDLVEGRFGYRLKTTDYIYTTIGIGTDFKNRTPEYRFFFSISFLPFKEEELKYIEILREAE